MPDWMGYPPPSPEITTVPRALYPLARAGQALGSGVSSVDTFLGAVPGYLSEPVPLGPEPPPPIGNGDAGNLGTFLFGTGSLGAQRYEPPPEPQTPHIDGALSVFQRLAPDEAAAVFAKGATTGLPTEGALDTDWGGYATGLSQGQIEQDARAHQMIDRRFPMAGDFDPMEEQLGATANLRKLEELLSASPRPLSGPGGAFQQDERGVIRNVPELPITAGDESNLELLRRKLAAQTDETLRRQSEGANHVQAIMSQIEQKGSQLMERLRQSPEYLRADRTRRMELEDQLRERVAEARATYLQAFGISSGHPPKAPYGMAGGIF